jgi:general secretion pathway protein G
MIVRTATRASRATSRAAFTLMEIMVVVAIIVILAGVAVVSVTRYMEQARVDATRAKIAHIEIGVQDFYNRNHEYPTSLEVLTQRVGGLPAWCESKEIMDEWGHEIMIDPSQRHPQTDKPLIYSNGPNPGDPNSRITSW